MNRAPSPRQPRLGARLLRPATIAALHWAGIDPLLAATLASHLRLRLAGLG